MRHQVIHPTAPRRQSFSQQLRVPQFTISSGIGIFKNRKSQAQRKVWQLFRQRLRVYHPP